MVNERIDACFDSHVHWAATGGFAERLRLESIGSASEIRKISRRGVHLLGGWLLGFGWDQSGWPDRHLIHRDLLDEWVQDVPVLLTRVDGHVGWVNTAALKAAGWFDSQPEISGGRIERDENGPTGVLTDKAYEEFRRHLPPIEGAELRRHLLKASQIFHIEGITHIRDVGANKAQWRQALLLDQAQLLKLAVEIFFHVEDLANLEDWIAFTLVAQKEATANLRPKGLKVFLDGALGSEGAWLSRPYASGSGSGSQILSEEELTQVLRAAWSKNLEVAVHAIGDAAAHCAVSVARALKSDGVTGILHLEHAEILRADTLELMKSIDVRCHLQPCQWLSDQKWLKEKIGTDLYGMSFPWRRLQEANIEFDFGSDTPIEPPSVTRTLQALDESAASGIPKLLGMGQSYLSHKDLSWAPNSFTIFENGHATQVVFRGDHLL